VHRSKSDRIPTKGMLLLVVVSFLWGGNIVSIKISNEGIPPLLAATVRSLMAAAIVWAYARTRAEDALMHGSDFKHGLVLGLLFAADFVLLYLGPSYTDASRAVIFLYIQPFLVAVGAHFLIPGDALTASKAIGLALAFAGLVAVFGSHSRGLGPDYWIGDLFEMGAASAWAFTTIYIKKFVGKRPINHYQTLFAQLFYSVPFMLACWLLLEYGKPVTPTVTAVAALAYQTIVIAGFSYILWFWMIHNFPVSKLAAFTFLAPLFGVVLSGLILGEALPLLLWIGLVLVASGIYMVNRPSSRQAIGG
jgi:drug/metabolite transporter (DMT)-like permease